jgi:hypothetical protein
MVIDRMRDANRLPQSLLSDLRGAALRRCHCGVANAVRERGFAVDYEVTDIWPRVQLVRARPEIRPDA